MRRLAAALIGCVLLAGPAAAADVPLYGGAGSLRGAMLRIAEAFHQSGDAEVTASFGPSGTMRERIEAGDKVDVFTSTDTGHPQRLNQEGLGGPLVVFARNRLCAIAPSEAYRLALFILSPAGQAILADAGFDTPTAP